MNTEHIADVILERAVAAPSAHAPGVVAYTRESIRTMLIDAAERAVHEERKSVREAEMEARQRAYGLTPTHIYRNELGTINGVILTGDDDATGYVTVEIVDHRGGPLTHPIGNLVSCAESRVTALPRGVEQS